MQFKIDENLPIEIANLLNDAGHNAKTIHDEDLVGQPDSTIADVCRNETRILVTLDRDFADIRTYPPSDFHGIVVLRSRLLAKPNVLALVQSIIPLLDREPVEGCLWIVSEGGVRIRERDAGA
jgi:predicted nuclease of predicted toxin-antitoxin system